jgi:RNA polymerase sigma-70 factor (ECF subfamily)
MKNPVRKLGLVPAATVPPRRDPVGEALDLIYEQHVAEVFRWVRRLVGPREEMEDLVHDVFLVAVRRRGEFRGDGSVRTWLFRITHNVVRGWRRRGRIRRWLFSRHTEDLPARHETSLSPLDDIEQREHTARLYAALDRLPDCYRTPLILYEIEGLSGDQVAELTGVRLGAIWVRLHRGRARLRRELTREDIP